MLGLQDPVDLQDHHLADVVPTLQNGTRGSCAPDDDQKRTTATSARRGLTDRGDLQSSSRGYPAAELPRLADVADVLQMS